MSWPSLKRCLHMLKSWRWGMIDELKTAVFTASYQYSFSCASNNMHIAFSTIIKISNIKRSIFNVQKRGRIRFLKLKKDTRLKETIIQIKKSKWKRAGHLLQSKDKNCPTEWTPYDQKRKRERQNKRWSDLFKLLVGPVWRELLGTGMFGEGSGWNLKIRFPRTKG